MQSGPPKTSSFPRKRGPSEQPLQLGSRFRGHTGVITRWRLPFEAFDLLGSISAGSPVRRLIALILRGGRKSLKTDTTIVPTFYLGSIGMIRSMMGRCFGPQRFTAIPNCGRMWNHVRLADLSVPQRISLFEQLQFERTRRIGKHKWAERVRCAHGTGKGRSLRGSVRHQNFSCKVVNVQLKWADRRMVDQRTVFHDAGHPE